MGRPHARSAALVVALGLVAAACSSGVQPIPKVPDLKPAATTTTDIDYSQIGLKGVTGRATTTLVKFGPGKANLGGSVIGAEGAIAGASVIVERFVDGASSQMVLVTQPDGTWVLPNVLGGRYRARAFRQPDLAQTSPSAVFIGATETKKLELHVRTLGGLSVVSSFAPSAPPINRDTELVVLVTEKAVDAQGVVRATPLPSESVELVAGAGWRVETANPAVTDSQGRAVWRLRCLDVGRNPLAVTVGTQSVPLTVNNCVDPVAETTTTSGATPTTQP